MIETREMAAMERKAAKIRASLDTDPATLGWFGKLLVHLADGGYDSKKLYANALSMAERGHNLTAIITTLSKQIEDANETRVTKGKPELSIDLTPVC